MSTQKALSSTPGHQEERSCRQQATRDLALTETTERRMAFRSLYSPKHDKIRRTVAPVCLGLAMLSATGCDREPARDLPKPPQVGVITVYPQPVVRTTELPGRTAAVMTFDVRPQASGIILKRLFTEGSEVKEGQSLYEIDPRPYQAQLAQVEADKAKGRGRPRKRKAQFHPRCGVVAEPAGGDAAAIRQPEGARRRAGRHSCGRRSRCRDRAAQPRLHQGTGADQRRHQPLQRDPGRAGNGKSALGAGRRDPASTRSMSI